MAKPTTTIHTIIEIEGESPFCVICITGDKLTEHWAVDETPALRELLGRRLLRALHETTKENSHLKAGKQAPPKPVIFAGPGDKLN